MNDTIGYATYQQQYNSTSSSTAYQTNDTISIVLFFSIIALLLLSFVLYFWYTERHKIPVNQRGDQAVGQQQEIYLLVDNISSQVKTTFRIPIVTLIVVLWKKYTGKTTTIIESTTAVAALDARQHATTMNMMAASANNTTATLAATTATNTTTTTTTTTNTTTTTTETPLILHEHQRVYHSKLYHLFSLLFIVSFVIALSILVGAVNSTIDDHASTLLLQAALFVFVLSVNLYLITRQRCYYMERRKLFGEHDAHINAIYDTRFSNWDKSMWSNWVQITILIIEFFQLMTFPLRDLITVTSLVSHDDEASSSSSSTTRQTETSQLISFILNAGGLMPDMRTPTWYTYSLWTAFAVTCVSLILGLVIHGVNYKYPYKLPTRWVRWCIPVATLLYIPILTTFVSSAACQSLNIPTNDFSVTLRCNAPSISRQLYLWLSLFGYMIAYFLMTIFLTSYERVPTKNEIAYKSIGVAFIKNMGLLLAIVFLLVESTTNVNRMRAILSITILLTMICYNIKTRPCYVDKINFFRTASFTCILWTSALVAILSDTNAAQSLGPLTVIYIIIGGWIFIILCFITVYFIYYIQPPDHEILSNSLNATAVDLSSSSKYNNNAEYRIYNDDLERSSDQQNETTTLHQSQPGLLSRWFSWTSTTTTTANNNNKEANNDTSNNRYY